MTLGVVLAVVGLLLLLLTSNPAASRRGDALVTVVGLALVGIGATYELIKARDYFLFVDVPSRSGYARATIAAATEAASIGTLEAAAATAAAAAATVTP